MDRDLVIKELQAIVDEFNKYFAGWSQRHGCVANFGWEYSPYSGVGSKPVKTMVVNDVDYIVYRKPAPSPQVITQKLGDLAKEV